MRSVLAVLFSSCLLVACNEGGPGAGCSPGGDNNGGCQAQLVCQADSTGANVCQIPLGGECEVGSNPSYCVGGSECIEVTEVDENGEEVMVGRCYLPFGADCDPTQDVQCDPSLQCAPLASGGNKCFFPVAFRGTVTDSATGEGIEGAHILALDETPTAATDIAISEADGAYRLDLPVLRNDDGTPMLGQNTFTLRAAADGYLTFPGGIRQALPVDTNLAMEVPDEGWFIEGTIADIVLVPVADPTAPRITVSGHVVVDADNQVTEEAGVLVVANPSASGELGQSGLSDLSGEYTIFNVTPGEYEVRGYRGGLQFTPQAISAGDADLEDIDLVVSSNPLNTVLGDIRIVGTGSMCSATSIVLVVESTFDELIARGEFAPGLRAPPLPEAPSIVPGTPWMISGIPDGRYVVLAAFENDGCVRDPDTCIGGTQTVHIELPTQNGMDVGDFNVTDALTTVRPGADAPEEVTERPTLEWGTDSNAEDYVVEVFDAYGNIVFTQMPADMGGATQSLLYSDPGPFDPGMFYQFRSTSRRVLGTGEICETKRTEDLRGVFFVP